MILGIALVVDELNKGPRLVIRYPDSSNVSQGVDTASVILYRLQTEFISISTANFAKLFRPKPSLCEKVVELTINQIKYISYACNCPQLSETTTERLITQYNIIIAKARDDIICSRIIDTEHVSRYLDTKSVKEVVSMFAVTLKKLEIYNGYVSDQVRIMLQYIDELDISNNTTSRTPLVSETITSNTTTTTTNMNNTANINNSTYNTQISKNISGSNDSATSTVLYQPIVTNNLSDNSESIVSTNNINSNTGMNSIGVGNDSYTSQIKDISTGYGNSVSGSSSATAQLNNMHLSSGTEVNIRASRYINTLQSPSQYSTPPYSWNTTTVSPQGHIASNDSMMMATTTSSQVGTMNINNTTNNVLSSSSSVNTLTTVETTPTIITTTQTTITNSNITNTINENNTNINMNTMVDNIYKQKEVLDKMIRASSLANELRIFYHQLIDNKEVNLVLDQQYNIYVPLSYMNSNATNVRNNHHIPSHFSPRYTCMDMDKSDNFSVSKRFDNTMMMSSSSSKSWTTDQLQPYHSLLLLDSYENTIKSLIHRLYPSALHSSTADEYVTATSTTAATGTTMNNRHNYRSGRENNSSSNQRISPNSRHPSIQGRGMVHTNVEDDDDDYNSSSEDEGLNYSRNDDADDDNEYNLDEISTTTSTSISSKMNHDNVVNHIDNHHRGHSPPHINSYSNNTTTTTLEKLLPTHLIQFLKVIDSTQSFIEYCPLLQLSLHEIYEVALVLVRYECGRIIHVITEDSIYQISPYIIHSSSSSSRSTLLTHRNSIKEEESSDQWEKYNQEFMKTFLQTQDTSEELSEGTNIEVDKDIHIHTRQHRNSISNHSNGDNIPNLRVGDVSEVNSLRKRRYTPISSVPTNIHITDDDDSRSSNINQTISSSHNSMSDKGRKPNYAYHNKDSDKNTSQSMKNPVVSSLSIVMNDNTHDQGDTIVCSLDINNHLNRTNAPIEINPYMYLKYILSLFQNSRNLKTINSLFPSLLQSEFVNIIIWLFKRQLIQEVETYLILPPQKHTITNSITTTSSNNFNENIFTSIGSVSRSIAASSPLTRQMKSIPTDNTMKIQDNPSIKYTTNDSTKLIQKECEKECPYRMISNHNMIWYEQMTIDSFVKNITLDQNNTIASNSTMLTICTFNSVSEFN